VAARGMRRDRVGARNLALPSFNPKLAKLAGAGSVFGATAKGTIVHARGGELWLVSADGSRRRRQKRESTPPDSDVRADWSQDGHTLTFITRHGDERGRRVVVDEQCKWARVVSASGELHPASACDAMSADGRLCLTRGTNHVWFTVAEPATGRTLNVAPPTRGKLMEPSLEDWAWTQDGSTLYLVARFRSFETFVEKGSESGLMMIDWSPLYRLRLPKTLPANPTKPVEPEYFLPGDTSVHNPALALSPNDGALLWLQAFETFGVRPLGEVTWLKLPKGTRTNLGERHKLVGERSWVNDAKWSPDGKAALLTIAMCDERSKEADEICATPHYELVLADEQRVGFVARGRHAAWTPVDALQ
jgi:hypothetical protein